MVNLSAAAQFVAGHARLIDRRRFEHLTGDGSAEAVLTALAAYRNPDGGIGYLEPDLRTPASQPIAVIYAFEVMHEVGIADPALTAGALDWLATVSTDDGGVPFVLPTARGWPHAPFFPLDDEPAPSLLATAGIAAAAHRLGLDHPWLDRAGEFTWERAQEARTGVPYTFRAVVDFLDAVPDRARVDAELEGLAERVPADGVMPVEAGIEGEVLRPLDIVPRPDHVARRLYDDAVIERELDRLEGEQQADGGWEFDFAHWNPAAALEWRGVVTVQALRTLRAYGRLD